MKPIERKMLAELLRNSRRSDRELAKAIGASQPTATRIRSKLEKEGYVKEYTAIPHFSKIGYTILAVTFMKLDPKLTLEEFEKFRENHQPQISKRNYGVILAKRGMGIGFDAVIISLHESYTAYDEFRHYLQRNMSQYMSNMDVFLCNLEEKSNLEFTFSLLANQILSSIEAKKEQAEQA
ncbi:MAG: winged helix-turn-helix transcriptional regulator [Candidatus Bathyarchaeia archaeon]